MVRHTLDDSRRILTPEGSGHPPTTLVDGGRGVHHGSGHVLSLVLFLPDLFRASSVVLVERQLPDALVRSAPGGELETRLHVIQQEVLSRANLTESARTVQSLPCSTSARRSRLGSRAVARRHQDRLDGTGAGERSQQDRRVSADGDGRGSGDRRRSDECDCRLLRCAERADASERSHTHDASS